MEDHTPPDMLTSSAEHEAASAHAETALGRNQPLTIDLEIHGIIIDGEIVAFDEVKASPGTYALLLHVKQAVTLSIGRLGPVQLQTGHYIYVGSALGPGGVLGRVKRHLRPPSKKRAHWHIDALTPHGMILEVWWSEGTERNECAWARILTSSGSLFTPGFGASDCRCTGHLIWLGDMRGVAQGWRALKNKTPYLQRARVDYEPNERYHTK